MESNIPPIIGYHCSQEQFSPSSLLEFSKHAQQAGFGGILSSDHFFPWSSAQKHSGFAFSWLGASLSSTSTIPHGVVTCASGWRYEPTVIAQASATLAEMFPGRFWMALGSGQALNEHIVAKRWPSKLERNARLCDATSIIRRLHQGELVSESFPSGIKVDRARLSTLPRSPVPLIGAALSPETAALVAEWADGLITINCQQQQLLDIINAFLAKKRAGVNKLILQAHISYAKDEQTALNNAMEQWKVNSVGAPVTENLSMPEDFDALNNVITEAAVRKSVFISANLDDHVAYLQSFIKLGFTEIYIHNVGLNQSEFINDFGSKVLPKLK